MPRLLLVLLLLVTGCASSEPDALEQAGACEERHTTDVGPLLLQEPPPGTPGPSYNGRTDGPCGLLLTFVGAAEGDGPCAVAEYVGTVEPAGEDLRLVVEERHTGEQPTGTTACTLAGHAREMRVQLEEPLGGRRLLDERGTPLRLVDGDRLVRPGPLPAGWTTTQEGQNAYGPTHWSHGLRGPDGQWGELRQGSLDLTRERARSFGYREVDRPTVRGSEALLVSYDEEQPGNLELIWAEGDRGFALQVMGRVDDPALLVELANALEG